VGTLDDASITDAGIALQKIRLDAEFEEAYGKSTQWAELMSALSGCDVLSEGTLLLILGNGSERKRALDYAGFLSGMKNDTRPHIADLDGRKDLITEQLPSDAAKSRWLKAELKKLSFEKNVCIFFDDWKSDEMRRLVFAGPVVESGGEELEEIKDKAEDLVLGALKWESSRREERSDRWSSWQTEDTSSSSSWLGWNPKRWQKEDTKDDWQEPAGGTPAGPPPPTPFTSTGDLPPPTPGSTNWSLPPATPGATGHFAPATPGLAPATPGAPSWQAVPATPAAFAAHSCAASTWLHSPVPVKRTFRR